MTLYQKYISYIKHVNEYIYASCRLFFKYLFRPVFTKTLKAVSKNVQGFATRIPLCQSYFAHNIYIYIYEYAYRVH